MVRIKPRRGVVLLLVLSLLTLFLLIGISFMIVSSQYVGAARVNARVDIRETRPEKQLDDVMMQLLRGTNVRSSLDGHAFLEDLYGYDGFGQGVPGTLRVAHREEINNLDPTIQVAGGQFVKIYINRRLSLNPIDPRLLDYPAGFFNGRVLTVTNSVWPGPDGEWGHANVDDDGDDDSDPTTPELDDDDFSEAGTPNTDDVFLPPQSFRIVDFNYDKLDLDPLLDDTLGNPEETACHFVIVEILSSDYGNLVPGPGQPLMINGAPFNGTGAGFDLAQGKLNKALDLINAGGTDPASRLTRDGIVDRDFAYALLPHFSQYTSGLRANAGGADESYDAVDFQNMFLAMVKPDVNALVPSHREIIPSFHRPALVNYWFNWCSEQLFTDLATPDPTKRQVDSIERRRQIFLKPYGDDFIRGTADDPQDDNGSTMLETLDFIVGIRRGCIMRPLPEDHPNFTGSNLAFNVLIGTDQRRDGALNAFPNAVDDLPTSASGPGDGIPDDLDADIDSVIDAYDVDNDGDAFKDSIWLDVGLPMITLEDGTLAQPLAAILVKDMDSRLNLNANGSLTHDTKLFSRHDTKLFSRIGSGNVHELVPVALSDDAGTTATTDDVQRVAAPVPPPPLPSTVELARGRGYGPAETYLAHIFGVRGRLLEFRDILKGGRILPGRYGVDDDIAPPPPGGTEPVPPLPGAYRFNDYLSNVHAPLLPQDADTADQWSAFMGNFSAYATPPDPFGVDSIALDPSGHPYYPHVDYIGTTTASSPDSSIVTWDPTVDDPYELNLSRAALSGRISSDQPFTYAEFEPLLRYYDHDSRWSPGRLMTLGRNTFAKGEVKNQRYREVVTVESRHIPAPNFLVQPELRSSPADRQRFYHPGPDRVLGSDDDVLLYNNIIKMFAERLQPDVPLTDLRVQLEIMVPMEIRRGGLLNVNRQFGDGRDNNGNNVVDEPFESIGPDLEAGTNDDELAWRMHGLGTMPNNTNAVDQDFSDFENAFFNHVNNDLALRNQDAMIGPAVFARQIYARHLFCLALMLSNIQKDTSGGAYFFPTTEEPVLSDIQKHELTIRRLAQWAVNVVDFRDSDAIMTAFEYDTNPFDGWDVDGDPSTTGEPQRGLVWGCEYPELLLTEIVAFHDRRVEDTNDDTSTMDRAGGDPHLDQVRMPEGSLFLELKSTRQLAATNRQYPQELYTREALDLGRLAPRGTGTQRYPVWRVAITETGSDGQLRDVSGRLAVHSAGSRELNLVRTW